jgi:transposase
MTVDDLKEIFRRWHSGHSITSIKQARGYDRNTIRNYINLFKTAGYSPGCILPPGKNLIKHFQAILPLKSRSRSIRKVFEAHKDEIIELITRAKEPVKPKTAFIIIKAKYELPGSYETFKLFMREHKLEIKKFKAPLRIEFPPGKETQIDYGKVGMLYDPLTVRNRIVWAFCARLSFSRLPYIEFVFTQKQEGFVESNVSMAEFYGGLTDFISIDNLKAGVIKPDLYDPRINRAYADFAEYYGTFINPYGVSK